MKKLLILTVIFALVLVGCSEEEEVPEKQLTIKNESSRIIDHTTWNNTVFHILNFSFIPSGRSVTETVQAGSSYIFFETQWWGKYRTIEIVTVNDGKNEEFIFTDNTLIVSENGNESVRLGDVY